MITIPQVLEFWYSDFARPRWFVRDDAFDRAVCDLLRQPHEAAAEGRLSDWQASAAGSLALAILLDQVPRNAFRGTPRAFATDGAARAVARHALAQGFDLPLTKEEKLFFYLPFEHSENLDDQWLAVSLFRERVDDPGYVDFAERHLRIIERFGRFPHRNAVLGRPNTAAEEEFLAEPGSSF